jgi:molecular chaperone DnaK
MGYFGIDFGTTNTSAVEVDGRAVQRYGDEQGKPLPSVIILNKATDRVIGGREAWNRRMELQQVGGFEIVGSIKQCLESDRHWVTTGRTWTPCDIAAEVLKQLSDRARKYGVASGIQKATFSIPVGLSANARGVLRDAAALAGIEVSSFVAESTAAFIRYFTDLRHCRHVAIFDWGGGTLDISVLRVDGSTIYELAKDGMTDAGDVMDQELGLLVHRMVMAGRSANLGPEEVPTKDRDQLLIRSEMAKCQLSMDETVPVALERYAGSPASIVLSRKDAAVVLMPFVDRAIELLASTVASAKLSVDALDDIVVIGGSSQLWLLDERLGADPRFSGRYRLASRPEWDVAQGAAILEQTPGNYELAETLGVQLCDGTHFELVRRGDPLETRVRTLSLALVEDTTEANVIIDRWAESGSAVTNALQFSVQTLGFLNDEIRLNYQLTRDLAFKVTAESASRGPALAETRQFSNLRFGYHMGEGNAR